MMPRMGIPYTNDYTAIGIARDDTDEYRSICKYSVIILGLLLSVRRDCNLAKSDVIHAENYRWIHGEISKAANHAPPWSLDHYGVYRLLLWFRLNLTSKYWSFWCPFCVWRATELPMIETWSVCEWSSHQCHPCAGGHPCHLCHPSSTCPGNLAWLPAWSMEFPNMVF